MLCLPQKASGTSWKQELAELLAEIKTESGGEPPAQKTIYFVRHAESMSNVARESMKKSRIKGAVRLCASGFNSPLSDMGRQQLREVREKAQAIVPDVQAILHSPLARATQTALALFGDDDGRGGFRENGKYWASLKGLKEMKLNEHAQASLARSKSIMKARASAFIDFLAQLPWTTFALVGHSRFFSMVLSLMGANVHLGNASIWRVVATKPRDGRLQCAEPQLVAQPQRALPAPRFSDNDGSDEKLKYLGEPPPSASTLSGPLKTDSDEDYIGESPTLNSEVPVNLVPACYARPGDAEASYHPLGMKSADV